MPEEVEVAVEIVVELEALPADETLRRGPFLQHSSSVLIMAQRHHKFQNERKSYSMLCRTTHNDANVWLVATYTSARCEADAARVWRRIQLTAAATDRTSWSGAVAAGQNNCVTLQTRLHNIITIIQLYAFYCRVWDWDMLQYTVDVELLANCDNSDNRQTISTKLEANF